jgi:hypothetical protein
LRHLGVDDETFVRTVHDGLKPGRALSHLQHLPGAGARGPTLHPMADGQCPFTRELLEKGGFEVIAFDVSDFDACSRSGTSWASTKARTRKRVEEGPVRLVHACAAALRINIDGHGNHPWQSGVPSVR